MTRTRHGLMAIDPGTTTGVMITRRGIQSGLPPKEAFAESGMDVFHVDCTDEFAGAIRLRDCWDEAWLAWDMDAIPLKNRYLIYEDFILRPGKQHSSARTGLSPVRVHAYLRGLLHADYEEDVHYVAQQPAIAKQRWTNERLKKAGLWVVGKEHGRDAVRHGALYYVQHLQGLK